MAGFRSWAEARAVRGSSLHAIGPTKKPRGCRGFESWEVSGESVPRDDRPRVEPVVELDQHFVGREILVTGDVGIDARYGPRIEWIAPADGRDAAEAEIVATIL